MIFVTLGTQDKPFKRLIEAVERQVELGNITEEVIVQSGCTKYHSTSLKIIDYMPQTEHIRLLNDARIVITHAGAGTIIQCLENNKIIISAARKREFGEHVNNHQEQLLESFSKDGYVLPLTDFEKLNEVLEMAKNFKPKKFKGNNEHFINKMLDEINLLLE